METACSLEKPLKALVVQIAVTVVILLFFQHLQELIHVPSFLDTIFEIVKCKVFEPVDFIITRDAIDIEVKANAFVEWADIVLESVHVTKHRLVGHLMIEVFEWFECECVLHHLLAAFHWIFLLIAYHIGVQ